MYLISHRVATLEAASYVRRFRDVPRFMGYCRQCGSYGRVWGCPPFDFDVEALTDGFAQVTLWATTIHFGCETRAACHNAAQCREVSSEAIGRAWDTLLPFLYEQEAAHPGSRVFTGRCRLCLPQACSRAEGQACRHPGRLRHSLESVGFDVAGTARELLDIELQWSSDGRLPERLTLVTALFTREPCTLPLPPPA